MTTLEELKLEDKIKSYVLRTLEDAKKNKDYALSGRNQAYGVVFFSCNDLFDTYNKDLADWWDKEILPQFDKIIRGC